MRFVDLFAGLGGFHLALKGLGHECVFASELDPELQEVYRQNFPDTAERVHGDIRSAKGKVPPHDLLCAGFPCQPFSKSGDQRGLKDQTRGTLFHEIVEIASRHRPKLILLENVGNFERHDEGRTWRVVQRSLTQLGYVVRGTEHVGSGGHGLLSPHHLGYPQSRERFYIVASQAGLPEEPFPEPDRKRDTRLEDVLQKRSELSDSDRTEVKLTDLQVRCIDLWNEFLGSVPSTEELPSFPIWGDEIHARYPYEDFTPFTMTKFELVSCLQRAPSWNLETKETILELLPSYARSQERTFPDWKIRFIRDNRSWWRRISAHIPRGWVERLRTLPASLRKLEWHCKGERRDLWNCVLQFRPSGLRAKRYSSCPALVAMTETQIPILGREARFISRTEGLRLQGFPDGHYLPSRRDAAFRALGNAVHVGVAKAVALAAFHLTKNAGSCETASQREAQA